MIHLTTTPAYNPFFIEGVGELKNIKFFQDGKVLAQTGNGWIGISNNDFKTMNFAGEPKRKSKENLNVNYSYYIKGIEGIILYIYVGSLEHFEIREGKRIEDKEEIRTHKICSFSVSGIRMKPYLNEFKKLAYTPVNGEHEVTFNFDFKFIPTEHGKKMIHFAEVAKEHGINVSHYIFENLDKYFNISLK